MASLTNEYLTTKNIKENMTTCNFLNPINRSLQITGNRLVLEDKQSPEMRTVMDKGAKGKMRIAEFVPF